MCYIFLAPEMPRSVRHDRPSKTDLRQLMHYRCVRGQPCLHYYRVRVKLRPLSLIVHRCEYFVSCIILNYCIGGTLHFIVPDSLLTILILIVGNRYYKSPSEWEKINTSTNASVNVKGEAFLACNIWRKQEKQGIILYDILFYTHLTNRNMFGSPVLLNPWNVR